MKIEHSEKPKWQLHLEEILRGYKKFDYNEINSNLKVWLQSWSTVLENKYKDWFYNQLMHLGVSNYHYAGKEEIQQALTDGWHVLSVKFKPRPISPFCIIIRYAPDEDGSPSLQFKFTEEYGRAINSIEPLWTVSWSQLEVIPETEPIFKEGFVLTQLNFCFESYMRWAHKEG